MQHLLSLNALCGTPHIPNYHPEEGKELFDALLARAFVVGGVCLHDSRLSHVEANPGWRIATGKHIGVIFLDDEPVAFIQDGPYPDVRQDEFAVEVVSSAYLVGANA
jgi:hypothetical protein